jgi:hypothetical protein
VARWINDMIQQLKNFDANKSAPHECPQIVWAVLQGDTGVGNTRRELLEILRTHAALERIAATGARYAIHHADPKEPPLNMSVRMANGTLAVGYSGPIGFRLTADIAEAAADWAEAQAAPKVATCPCCGKRCAP